MPNMLSPEATLSYPNLFTPRLRKGAKPADKPKYGSALLFTEAATKTPEYKAMKDAVIAAAKERWGEAHATMLKEGVIDLPFKKDIGSQGYPDSFFVYINAESSHENPPAVVSRRKGPDGKPLAITDKREIYAGAVVRVSLGVYAYGGKGTDYKPGIRFGLRNVQKIGDGPRLDGRSNASDEFIADQDDTSAADFAGMSQNSTPTAEIDADLLG